MYRWDHVPCWVDSCFNVRFWNILRAWMHCCCAMPSWEFLLDPSHSHAVRPWRILHCKINRAE